MIYSPAFQKAVALILKHEGGYVDDPRDPGGETNFGISKRSYPREDIKALTVERATEIYFRDYWTAIRGEDLPAPLALVTFDMAVNAGVGAAVRLLQKQVGATIDGKMGPETIARAAGLNDPVAAARRLSRRRIRYYAALPSWSIDAYADSWTQRTLDTLVVAVTG